MDLMNLCSTLQACLSADQAQRTQAETVLKQLDSAPGQVVNLLRIAAEGTVDAAVRQVAAISFKNLVKRSWEDGEGKSKLIDADKQVVRENILESMIWAPHNVQVQLAETLRMIIYCDYPDKWAGLLPVVYNNLVSTDQKRVHGGLTALRLLSRKYEFRDDDDKDQQEAIITSTFPAVLNIVKALLANPETVRSADAQEYLKLACKIFWSATYMAIPSILLQPEQFMGWMQALHTAVLLPVPEDIQPSDPDERKSMPSWKAKKWVLHITYRLFNRYASTKHCKPGNDAAFSAMYVRDCMKTFLDAHLQLMGAMTTGVYLSPRCVNLLIQYITHATSIKDTYTALSGHWDNILLNIAFPIMCHDEEEARLWLEDPQEYIRKGYDILEDMYTPKTAAANLAQELCRRKPKAHLDKFVTMLSGLVQVQLQSLQAGQEDVAVARKMDGALLALGTLCDVLKKKSPYKEQLEPMLVNFVLPCFKSKFGHLRAKCAWVCGVYSDHQFQSGKGQGPTFNALFQAVMGSLADPDLPVRVDSVVAVRSFIDEVEDLATIRPILPQLLDTIFSLMDQVDNEDLVFTLEAIVERFQDDIAPYAVTLCQRLVEAFWRYSQSAEEDDDDDMAGIAAFGCLKALNTLLESVSAAADKSAASLTHLFPALEEIIYPIMQRMISSDGQDIFEEVLELASYFTFYPPTISDRMWQLWPLMHNVLMEWGINYWENILIPLDNFISKDTQRFLTSKNPDYLASVFQMVQHSLQGDFSEPDILPAAKLLSVVLQNCRGHVDQWVQPYLQLVLAKLSAGVKGSNLKDLLLLVVADALYYNPTLALQALQSLGAVQQVFGMWHGLIFEARKSGKVKHFKRMYDKKVCLLGLVSVLGVSDEVLAATGLAAGLPSVMTGIVKLLVELKKQEEEVEAEGDESEDEDDADEEEDGDWGEDDDEEELEKDEEAYMKKLQKAAQEHLGEKLDEEDDEDPGDEDCWTDEEEVQTPIDPIDPFTYFAEAMTQLQHGHASRYQALLGNMDGGAQQAVMAMMTHAAQQAAAKAQQPQ